jgi:serine/threonine protein phosphatase PrpC
VSGVGGTVVDWTGELVEDGGWALLADGLGGHVAGEVASALAIEVIRPVMPQLRTDDDVHRAVNAADTAIFMAMDMRPELRGMGTTIAGVVLRPDATITFNAGDSRIYALEHGSLTQTSIDDATKGGALLQCLGGYQEPVPIHVHVQRFGPEAAVLLCSDGLTNMLSDDEIASVLASDPDNPASHLVEAGLAAGGHDNVSVIFIQRPGSVGAPM